MGHTGIAIRCWGRIRAWHASFVQRHDAENWVLKRKKKCQEYPKSPASSKSTTLLVDQSVESVFTSAARAPVLYLPSNKQLEPFKFSQLRAPPNQPIAEHATSKLQITRCSTMVDALSEARMKKRRQNQKQKKGVDVIVQRLGEAGLGTLSERLACLDVRGPEAGRHADIGGHGIGP